MVNLYLSRHSIIFFILPVGMCFLQTFGNRQRTHPVPNQSIKMICNLVEFNFIISSCWKPIERDYSDPISRCRENAVGRHLRAVLRQLLWQFLF